MPGPTGPGFRAPGWKKKPGPGSGLEKSISGPDRDFW